MKVRWLFLGLKKDANVIEHHAVLREGNNGWRQELNVVSWYGQEPKFDIRWWSSDKGSSGKGITLRDDELFKLHEALNDLVDNGVLGGNAVYE